MIGLTKSTATVMAPMNKAGAGYDYDDPALAYDSAYDADGRRVLYDGVGTAPVMAGLAKSDSTTLTTLTKHAA